MPSRLERRFRTKLNPHGFSMLELLTSVAIITLLMTIVFQFLNMNQKRHRSQQLLGEMSQGGRSAIEVVGQELNQAGYNPPFLANKSVGTSPPSPSGTAVSLPISALTTPKTQRISYGTRLIIGNACAGTVCNQEEVVVNADPSYGSVAMTATTAPVVITNTHTAGEPIFVRNYPYPNGILYDNRTAGTGVGISDNKIRFFGDILNTGDMYYGEYRLQCPGTSPGTYIDACTTGCMTAPFTLTRFMTKLADPTNGFFKIPASKSAALDGAQFSPLVDNIQGTCASTLTGLVWPQAIPDETSSTGTSSVNKAVSYSGGTTTNIDPVMNTPAQGSVWIPALWFKMNTYGAFDNTTTPPTPYFQSFVLDVRVTLTVQEAQKDPETGTYRTQRLQGHIVPRNINDALGVAPNGGSLYLPPIPLDPSTCSGSPPTCNTLPLP
jgi:prepilin-type N-terminal cleavage/methylation domain-containing protein